MSRRRRKWSLVRAVSRLPRSALVGLLVLVLLPYLIAPLYAFGKPVSTVMIWRWLTGARVERIYERLSHISPNLQLAVIISEDGRFCTNYGVDFGQIRNAFATASDLEDIRGASTITQQVAKNLFLWPARSYLRKALEFPLALWLNLVLSKQRILEIYLNIAEWGPDGQFGVEAGSRYAFGKSVRKLSRYQAALLAAVLPNPHDRDARRPEPDLRRLAELYVERTAHAPAAASCLRPGD